MASMEKMEPGVNGVILPVTRGGRDGYVFQAPDGSQGPFHPSTGPADVRAFAQARADWRDFLNPKKLGKLTKA